MNAGPVIAFPFAVAAVFLLMLPMELARKPSTPAQPAVASTEPAPIEVWWSNLGREKAGRTCTKESLLVPLDRTNDPLSTRAAYYRLCMEEKGFK